MHHIYGTISQMDEEEYPDMNNRLIVSKAQEELLLWHNVFGHYTIHNTQRLMTSTGVYLCPVTTPKNPGASTCTAPLCRSYLSGEGIRASLQAKKRLHIQNTQM